MKKQYIAPTTRCINIQTETLLQAISQTFSNEVVISNQNPAGEYDVTAKKRKNDNFLWDFSEDDDE